MEYQVPQFIEEEAKIIGPFTLKQFGFLGGALAIVLITLMVTQNLAFTLVIGTPIGLIAFALVFVKINGLPLPTIISWFFGYLFSPKKFLWEKKEEPGFELKEFYEIEKVVKKPTPTFEGSRLRQTFWEIETGQKIQG